MTPYGYEGRLCAVRRAMEAGYFDELLAPYASPGKPGTFAIAAMRERVEDLCGEPIPSAEAEVWIYAWRVDRITRGRLCL